MICPKCGFQQDEGSECLRCGLIFVRYRAVTDSEHTAVKPKHVLIPPTIGPFRRFYRIFRWISLAILVIVIILILHDSPPPQIAVPPDAAQHAEAKILEFQAAAKQGTEQRIEMDQSELNGWLGENLALNKSRNSMQTPSLQTPESLISLAKTATGSRAPDDTSLEQAQSSVRDVKIELLENSLRLFVAFDMHGMDLTLELEGNILVRDGYIRLEPTGGKLGSFPLLAGTLKSVTGRLFDSPENKEKFRLPAYIRDIQIEHGKLVLISL
jgi:hypothetical protein